MAEHGTGGVSAVMAPHPDRLRVWCVMTCGCCWLYMPPPCFDRQGNIDSWFEQRRDSVARQMGMGDGR